LLLTWASLLDSQLIEGLAIGVPPQVTAAQNGSLFTIHTQVHIQQPKLHAAGGVCATSTELTDLSNAGLPHAETWAHLVPIAIATEFCSNVRIDIRLLKVH